MTLTQHEWVVHIACCESVQLAAVLLRDWTDWTGLGFGWVGQPDTNFETFPLEHTHTPPPFPEFPTGGTCLGLCCRSPKVSVPCSFLRSIVVQ